MTLLGAGNLSVAWTMAAAVVLTVGSPPSSLGGMISRLPEVRQRPDRTLIQQLEGKSLFDRSCAACHGKTGGGDGPAAKGLKPKPASFHDSSFQTGRTDQQLTAAIQNGKPPMPAFGKQLSPAQVASLVNYIRALGQPAKKT